MNLKLIDRLLTGIEVGVHKHWRYQKSIDKVKPEYLFTVATADELTKGFDGIHGMDLKIHLEKPVFEVTWQGLLNKVGLHSGFKKRKSNGKTSIRNGRVDICIEQELGKEIYVVEIKGFDPNASEIKKEVKRFVNFFEMYESNTSIESCFLIFPSKSNKESWLEQQIKAENIPNTLQYEIKSTFYLTHESPEDGLPCFYANALRLYPVNCLTTSEYSGVELE